MNLYFKRGMQGRWKQSIDGMGDQYDPTHMDTHMLYVLDTNSETRVWTDPQTGGYVTMRRDLVNSMETTTGHTGLAY